MLSLNKRLKIYMLGIGGAGMSAMAEFLSNVGHTVAGYDALCSDNTDRLQAKGIEVHIGKICGNIGKYDLCVYSAALSEDDPALVYAKTCIKTITRAELFEMISARFDEVIAVSGTHGKTTVTSMLCCIYNEAGKSYSSIIGGYLPEIGGNGHYGGYKTLICEACEFAGTFLSIHHTDGIVLNIDNDHLEYFGTREGLCEAFQSFSASSQCCIVNGDDSAALCAGQHSPECVTFGFGQTNDFSAGNLKEENGKYSFTLFIDGKSAGRINLNVPGKHNVLNALAAVAAATQKGISTQDCINGVSSFGGAARRFEVLYNDEQITVADDYAHHPAEIKAVLNTAAEMNYKRVIAVFQPFTYSRTAMLLEEFAEALSLADVVILCEIMGGRENNDYNISSDELSDMIPSSCVGRNFDEASDLALIFADEGDLIITLGCGNVYKCARMIIRKIKESYD